MGEHPPPSLIHNIILTGFMGTGKSTVGQLLAERLDMEWVDTDHLIEERHGPIPDIFARDGEPAFRSMEREVAEELAGRTGLVISTGGRLLLDDTNYRLLREDAQIFCLTASPNEIISRLTEKSATDRPLLAADDLERRVTQLLAERSYEYGRFEQVDTDGVSAEDLAAMLAERLRRP